MLANRAPGWRLLAGQFGRGTGDCRCEGKKCRGPRKGPAGRSYDANDKYGAQGISEAQYLSGAEPLRYAIAFENVESASFPAQAVVVTDALDTASLDLDTSSLGPISFGDRMVVPPPGLQAFATHIDLRPAQPFAVRIEASLDVQTGLAQWRFRTVDPSTGEAPEDPRMGFLPPNRTSPEGEGSVLFTVKPRATLATGTEVRNRATIVFDDNAPIFTPVWRNTIDSDPPASAVLPLPATVPAQFPVRWSGSDRGAGVATYSLYLSEDGGPYVPWLLDTTDTEAIFQGEAGKRYAFYSIARDSTGNVEAPPPMADTSTRVLPCPGDCDGSGDVTVDELVLGVNIALDATGIDRCSSFDTNGDHAVTIEELLQGVNAALYSCGGAAE